MTDAPSSYPYVPLPDRRPLRFPGGARLALIVTINIEYWEARRPGMKEPLYPGGPVCERAYGLPRQHHHRDRSAFSN